MRATIQITPELRDRAGRILSKDMKIRNIIKSYPQLRAFTPMQTETNIKHYFCTNNVDNIHFVAKKVRRHRA